MENIDILMVRSVCLVQRGFAQIVLLNVVVNVIHPYVEESIIDTSIISFIQKMEVIQVRLFVNSSISSCFDNYVFGENN